jgi:hypothetical protein
MRRHQRFRSSSLLAIPCIRTSDEGEHQKVKIYALNGRGNWITRAFNRHLSEVEKGWGPAKRGLHFLRMIFIQEL